MNWFNVDKAGLAKLMEGRSKAFILHELIQNAWDQNVTTVDVRITSIEGTRAVDISVEDDDPEGFADLAHAYTLFAESAKKADPEKRGRFNLGEKLVLALAKRAYISTTKGAVEFTPEGRKTIRDIRKRGSLISLAIPMTKAEMQEVIDAAYKLIPPPGVKTLINGNELPERVPIVTFQVTLPTLIADDQGVLRPTSRLTTIGVYDPGGETTMLYEMGIPVVETGDKYHVDIDQKVPLNADRDNVTPAYLRAVRVAVLNAMFDDIQPTEAADTWVREAVGDERASAEAVKSALAARFGDNAVAYDPSDPEANKLSVAAGRPVIYGGNLSAGEWESARRAGVLPAAGQVTPSPKPFSPDGKPLNLIPPDQWTMGMSDIASFVRKASRAILNRDLLIAFANEPQWPHAAVYCRKGGELYFNVGTLGRKWFENGITDDVIDLVIHEFGHEYEGDHLSRDYNDALTKVGAQMTRLALDHPELFQ